MGHLDVLAQPTIPVSLRRVNLRSTVKGWWTPERARALDGWGEKCAVCGYTKNLEVHETYLYDWPSHIAMYAGPVVLCAYCHRFVHLDITYLSWLYRGTPKSEQLWKLANRGCDMLMEGGLVPSTGVVTTLRRIVRKHLGKSALWFIGNLPPEIPGQWHRPWRLYVPGNGLLDKEEAIERERFISSTAAMYEDVLATLAAKHKHKHNSGGTRND